MNSNFTIRRLMAGRAVVSGTDVTGAQGQIVVSTSEWDDVKARDEFKTATADFDAAVQEFFAPLTEAAEKVNQKINVPDDPASYVVLDEGVEARAGRPADVIRLSKDSIILRMVEGGSTDRLVWVGDQLEVAEAMPAPTATVSSTVFEDQGWDGPPQG